MAEGNLGNVISAAVPLVLRLGTGALVNGYAPSLVDDDEPTKYSIVRFAGKRLDEANALGPRPALPIEVFEYEGSPYCRKVRRRARASTSTSSTARAPPARATGARWPRRRAPPRSRT